jgi:patatin-like phospholipase/acyl hydrolase
MSGTSIGEIIALALADEIPAKTIVEELEFEGYSIFSDRPE